MPRGGITGRADVEPDVTGRAAGAAVYARRGTVGSKDQAEAQGLVGHAHMNGRALGQTQELSVDPEKPVDQVIVLVG